MTQLDLIVTDIAAETPTVHRITLARPDGAVLPGYEPAAHLTFTLPGVGVRKYSLVNSVTAPGATAAPRTYTLGIRLTPDSAGGSRFMHALKVGDHLSAGLPGNDFPLKDGPAPIALLAGGIGVTPLVTMAAALKASGRPFSFLYAARSRTELAFLAEVTALAGGALVVHTDEEAGRLLDVGSHLAGQPDGVQVYMCGPRPMLKAALDAAKKLGWARDRLSFELFYSVAAPKAAAPAPSPSPAPVPAPPPPKHVDDGSFEVVLKSSGRSFRVPRGKTILDVLIEAGLDPVHDCKRGECGVCQVGVVEGVPEHLDNILSDSERAANKTIQICISRSKTPRLVLDL